MRAKASAMRHARAGQGLGVGQRGGRGEGQLPGRRAAGLVDDARRWPGTGWPWDRFRPAVAARWRRRSGAPRSARDCAPASAKARQRIEVQRQRRGRRGLGRRAEPVARRPAPGSRRRGRPAARSVITPSSTRARSSRRSDAPRRARRVDPDQRANPRRPPGRRGPRRWRAAGSGWATTARMSHPRAPPRRAGRRQGALRRPAV